VDELRSIGARDNVPNLAMAVGILAAHAAAVLPKVPAGAVAYADAWRAAGAPHETLDDQVVAAVTANLPDADRDVVGAAARDILSRWLGTRLLEQALARARAACLVDPNRRLREYLFDLLRRPGDANRFAVDHRPESRLQGLPLMPLLAGDNPITNTLPASFLTLTELQYFLLSQWAKGKFYNEVVEGGAKVDPWNPYAGLTNTTGADLDRGVLANALGGAFCPGGEVSWIIRNPAIYEAPYRIKADPAFSAFRLTAAQASSFGTTSIDGAFEADTGDDLSQDGDLDTGLQPGDLTKYGGVPWQADFNECTLQTIDVTYAGWNKVNPANPQDSLLQGGQRQWDTLW
jgi:GNAT superfamily N-acetyltransferase